MSVASTTTAASTGTADATTSTPQGLMKLFSQRAEAGDLDPDELEFVGHPTVTVSARACTAEIERLSGAAALMRSHPDNAAPDALTDRIRELVGPGDDGILG